MKITYGADPEFFVQEIKTGNIIPSCGLFGGAKKAPIFLCEEGGYLEDGVTVEINVTPATTIVELQRKLSTIITAFHVKFPNYLLVPALSHKYFGENVLRKYPQATVLGCDADLWYYGIRNLPQVNQMKGNRFAGGHLHLGMEGLPTPFTAEAMIPLLDLLTLGNQPLVDTLRWKFYGHPGLYRNTSYGVEYRSLDNWWASAIIGHPLLDKGTFDRITHTAVAWDNDLKRLFDWIDYKPLVVFERLGTILKILEVDRYFSSQKMLKDPGVARLNHHYRAFQEYLKRGM